MGEAAGDIIDGNCCALCGQYFVEKDDENIMYEHGYPVACVGCWTIDCGYEKQDDDAIILG